MDLQTELKTFIIEDLSLEGVSIASIDDDAPLFVEGLGLDSLDAVELVIIVQKRFGVIIKGMDEAKAAFASINTLTNYIINQKSKG